MQKIKLKPLSVNKAWKGRRFKTPEYKSYERAVLLLLPNKYDVPNGKIGLQVDVGFSNKSSDLDNVAKLFIDILQKKYGFNDSAIYKLIMEKSIVKKGDDYIQFMMWSI